jgi:signal transduction histidine kinase
VLGVPLVARSDMGGVLSIARDADAVAFSVADRQLAMMVADALAAVIEIEFLHRRETKEAAEEERQRLARDLHDAVTQSVYGASLIAEALPTVWKREPNEGLRNLETLRRLVRAALAEMRTLLFELRPATLDAAPLDTLLQRLGDSLGGQAQISVDIHVDEDVSLPRDVKLVFYRVTQEAFSNIGKHARANHVTAVVGTQDGGAILTVRDDGNGFDPGAVTGDHMGLRIMRERLDRVEGSLAVDSARGRGTTITAVWPRPDPNGSRHELEET